jgi:hypothetical protein
MKYSMDEIMGTSKPNKMMKEFAIYALARKKARKRDDNRRVDDLAERLAGLNLGKDYDQMDTSNLADGYVVTDEDGNEFICYATRSVKKK